MGGLVCRVANLLLREPGVISGNRQIFQNYCDDDRNAFTTLLGLGLHPWALCCAGKLPKQARKTMTKAILRKFSDAVGLGPVIGGERIWELTQKFAANLGGRGLRQGVGRSSAKLLDGGFEASKEGLTGFATIEVLL